MGCEYCKGDKNIIDDIVDNINNRGICEGIVMNIYSGKLNIYVATNTYDLSLKGESIEINYCPFCGRKLNDIGGELIGN